MDFVNLNRFFAPISKDQEATLEWGPDAGRKYGGWLVWPELLQRQRVVLLAEALSGKTDELKYQSKRLRAEGKHAYFVTIEDLVDSGFKSALDEAGSLDFEEWKNETVAAWFFLDSIDEARLNAKNFGSALRCFAKELGRENLGRAHVFVTCRVSDWHGKHDRELINELLPIVTAPFTDPGAVDPDQALLGPIFEPSQKIRRDAIESPKTHPAELAVVQLVPLSYEQKQHFAHAAGVLDSHRFMEAVDRSGVLEMTERPGDLVDLIGYWKEHGAFGSLQDMTDEGIRRKLREESAHRSDADQLTSKGAREGAERLAAALVFGRSFTFRAPSQGSEADLSAGAIDPLSVLHEWTPAQVSTLLRRGLFAPATYGRVRFHHRSTQEFLAASWLRRLLATNCPVDEVRRLLFVELYEVKTVRPALRAVAAWLSLNHPGIRYDVMHREPVCLIVHGDPKSLPIEVRERLLEIYALLDSKGELNAESIDNRAVWMFSDPSLASAIRRSWAMNERSDFRLQLLRFIAEARITACVDLAREIALDAGQDHYLRIMSARALHACDDTQGLQELAAAVRAAPDKLSARLAPELALLLYPRYLDTPQLLDLIDRSQPARRFQVEGFASHLGALCRVATDRRSAQQLAFGVAELFLSSHSEVKDVVANRHAELGKGLAELAQLELQALGGQVAAPGLIRLLMAVERVHEDHSDELLNSVSELVRSKAPINRELMWADACTGRRGGPRDNPPTRVWQIGPFYGHQLWCIGPNDIDWLTLDVKSRPLEYERRVAFSALCMVLQRSEAWKGDRAFVEELAARELILRSDLQEMEAEPDDPYAAERAEAKLKRRQEVDDAKQSWKNFRDELSLNPNVLDAKCNLVSWRAGLFRLHHLTRWLQAKAGGEPSAGAKAWRLLRPVFGDGVAEHYFNGMRLVWRSVRPERPQYHGNGSYTTKHTSLLALQSLAIEQSENPNWAQGLTRSEVRLAAQHGCYVGDSGAEWFLRLSKDRLADMADVIRRAVAIEYASEGARTDLLVHAANAMTPIGCVVATRALQLLGKSEPADDRTLDAVLHVLRENRRTLPNRKLLRIVKQRLDEHIQAGADERALLYFTSYLVLAPDEAAYRLCDLLAQTTEEEAAWRPRAEKWLGTIFGQHRGSAAEALVEISVSNLLRLLKLLYRTRWFDDESAEVEVSRVRNSAEDARRIVLHSLIARTGVEAFHALLSLSRDPTFPGDSLRIREIAHGKAESDGDLVAWNEQEVFRFEQERVSPAKTGADLLRLILAVMSDIAVSFDHADSSSRSVLQLAHNEEQVQSWLTERLNERSKDRYHAHREPKVAKRNEPDIVVLSASGNVELAIEVKNANKGWTVAQLERTLGGQLARDYLRTEKRRVGILVVSLHKSKRWRKANEIWEFGALIGHLQTVASKVTKNETGAVEVRAFGIDSRDRN